MPTANHAIHELADADGHIIEPGDLWVERLPEELRPLGPHYFRDEDGLFHSKIYGLDISTLEVMQGGMRPKDMLDNMGLACAMGVSLDQRRIVPRSARGSPVWVMSLGSGSATIGA